MARSNDGVPYNTEKENKLKGKTFKDGVTQRNLITSDSARFMDGVPYNAVECRTKIFSIPKWILFFCVLK